MIHWKNMDCKERRNEYQFVIIMRTEKSTQQAKSVTKNMVRFLGYTFDVSRLKRRSVDQCLQKAKSRSWIHAKRAHPMLFKCWSNVADIKKHVIICGTICEQESVGKVAVFVQTALNPQQVKESGLLLGLWTSPLAIHISIDSLRIDLRRVWSREALHFVMACFLRLVNNVAIKRVSLSN